MIGPARIDENNPRRRQASACLFLCPGLRKQERPPAHFETKRNKKMKSPNDTNRVSYFMCWMQAVASARAKQKKFLQGCPVFKG